MIHVIQNTEQGSPEGHVSFTRWGAALFFLALATGLLLFARGHIRGDEGRYGEIAREMMASGSDAWTMRLLGVRYYEKPPMLYWMSAASMKAFGVNAAASRLPLLFCMVGTLALSFRWARQEWGRDAAWLGGFALSSCLGFVCGMSILLTDVPLVLFFSATCFFLFESYKLGSLEKRWPWLVAAAIAAWCGVLTKGFVAIVLPGAILFLWLLWERRLRDLWSWSLIPIGLGFLAALAAVGWRIEQSNPGFIMRFVVQEHVQRFLGTRVTQGHPEPVWFFLPILLALLFPWIGFVPRAALGMQAHGDLRRDSFTRFLLVWAVTTFVFFSMSSGKLTSYLLPLLPPAMLLISRRGLAPLRGERADRRWWIVGATVPLLAPVGIALFYAGARRGLWLQKFSAPAGAAFIPVVIALLLGAWVWRKGYWKTASGLVLTASGGYLAFAGLTTPLAGSSFLSGFDNNNAFYTEAAQQIGPDDQLIMCGKYTPALAFHTQTIPWIYGIRDELGPGMDMEPDRAGIFHTPAELYAAMASHPDRTYYAIIQEKQRHRLTTNGLYFVSDVLARDRYFVMLELGRP